VLLVVNGLVSVSRTAPPVVMAPSTPMTVRFAPALVAAGLLLTGCSHPSSVPQPVARTNGASVPGKSTALSPTQAAAAACVAFQSFYNDMITNTPHSPTLGAEIDTLQHDAIMAGTADSAKGGHLLDDATSLAAFFGSSAWAHDGNIQSRQVTALQNDCP